MGALAFLAYAQGTWAYSEEEYPGGATDPFIYLAQAAPTIEQAEPVEFSIPSQPLGSAITSFADQANYRLFVTSDLSAGVTSNGVTGRHTPEEALSLLLAGTGLTYRLTEARTVTLERVPIAPLALPMGQHQSSAAPSNNPNMQTQAASKPVKVPEIVVKEVENGVTRSMRPHPRLAFPFPFMTSLVPSRS
jgi:iron complex outermembrane receptor protein